MVVMNVWMPVMIAVSAVMMMGPIVFQTFLEDGGDECPSGLPDLLDLAHGLGDEYGDGLQDWLACGADLVPDSHEPCGEAVPESFCPFRFG